MAEITDRKTSKLVKRGRKRPLKNFFWWLFGFISSFLVFAGALALVICVFPIRTFTGANTDEYVNDEIGSGTLLNFIMNYQKWKVGDLPIIRRTLDNVITNSPLSHYVEIDFDGLDQLGYADFTSSSFDITEYITVTATLNTLIKDFQIDVGDLGSLSAFNQWTKVTEEIDTTASDFNPKLYYYRLEGSGSSSLAPAPHSAFKVKDIINGSDGFTYTRSYDDQGKLKADAVGKDLYMPALFDVPITNTFGILQPRFMNMPAVDLLTMAGIKEGPIFDMLQGYTLKGLNKFDTDTIKLSTFMPNDGTRDDVYKILEGATGVPANDVTIGDLNHKFEINRIEIASILSGDNSSLFKIIRSAQGLAEDHAITVGDLNGLNVKNIDITAVIEENEDTSDLYEILRSVTGKDTKDTSGQYPAIKISDLEEPLNFSKIKLTTVLDPATSGDLYEILRAATGKTSDDEITIGSLEGDGFNTKNVKLSSVIPNDANNEKLYNLLGDLTGVDGDHITIGDLDGMDFDNAKISTLMTNPSDELKDILVDGCSTVTAGYQQINYPVNGSSEMIVEAKCPAINNKEPSYLLQGEATYSGALYSVEFDLITNGSDQRVGTLTVKEDGTTIEQKDVIWEPSGEAIEVHTTVAPIKDYTSKFHATAYSSATYEEITVNALNNFDVGNVHLSNVISNEGTLNIIVSATGVEADDLRLRDLTASFDINKALIKDVLDLHYDNEHEDQKTFIRILVSACYSGVEPIPPGLTEDEEIQWKYDRIAVGDINNFTIDDVKLLDVIPLDGNETLYAILADSNDLAHTEDNYKTFTINTISSGIDFNKVHLTSVLAKTAENEKMYDILLDGSGAADYDSITIGDLSTLDIDGVHLTSIVPTTAGDGKLYGILKDATGQANEDDITVGMLETMDFDLVHITSFIDDDASHATILNILSSACGTTKANLTVASLDDFDSSNIHLADVLDPTEPANAKIYDIILDATGQTDVNAITVGMLSGTNFDIRQVKLSNAIDNSDTGDNKILNALLNDDTVTIGNLGMKINDIKLYDAYGDNVFTKTGAHAVNDKYVRSVVGGKVTYTYDSTAPDPSDSNDVYYISEEANIWLLFCFDVEDSDVNPANGRVLKYTQSSTTFANLVDGNITSRITETTIYNLIAAGMIADSGYPDALKAKSIQEVIDAASMLP